MNVPIQKYSDYTSHKGETVEIIGEVFSEPIKSTDSVFLHTHIRLLHKTIEVGPTQYIAEQLSFEDLKNNVQQIKKNVAKYLFTKS